MKTQIIKKDAVGGLVKPVNKPLLDAGHKLSISPSLLAKSGLPQGEAVLQRKKVGAASRYVLEYL